MKKNTVNLSSLSRNAHPNLLAKVRVLFPAIVIGLVCVCQIGCTPNISIATGSKTNQKTGGTSSGQTQVVHEDEWSRIYAVADAIAAPHKMLNITSEKELVQLMSRRSAELSLVSDVDPTLKPDLERIRRAYRTADLSFQKLKEIDAKIGKNIWEGLGSLGEVREEQEKPEEEQSVVPKLDTAKRVIELILYAKERAALISGLRQHEYDIRSTVAGTFPGVKKAAEKLAVATSPCSLEVSYDPAWHGALNRDTVVVKNAGDMAIENGVLLVDLIDDQGEHAQHLYTVDSLGSGDSLTLTYGYWSTDFYYSETRDKIRRINVSLVSLRHHGNAEWTFSQVEHDAHVKEVCQNLKFSGSYLPPKNRTFFSGSKDPGFSFKFSGLERLPVNRVEITFQGAFGSKTAAGGGQGYITTNKLVEKRSKRFPGQKPKQVSLRLGFRDTSYVHEVTWQIN